jgi:P4 family phage/plasmid primase-like protien
MAEYTRDFMNRFKAQNDTMYTHVSQMPPYLGKFNIERDNFDIFWKWYCDSLYTMNDEFLSGISEKPHSIMPILGDIDIEVPYEDGFDYTKRLYTYDQMKKTVEIYIDVLKYILKNVDNKYLYCFVLEKKQPYIKNKLSVKNGFHIHFPFLYLSVTDQNMHLLPRVVKQFDDYGVFSNLRQYSSDVIDKGVLKKFWLLYGSRKDMNLEAYKLTYIFDSYGNETNLNEVMKHNYIYNSQDNIINLTNEKNIERFLPMILSIHPLHRHTGLIKDNVEILVKQKMIKVKEIKGTFDNMPIQDAVILAKRLAEMLSPKRASNYETWIEVGWILFCIGNGCYEMLESWIQFSKKTTRNNFNEAYIVELWKDMHRGDYTLGSLRKYASEDNPEAYRKFTDEEKAKRIECSLNGGHYDIAKQLYDMFSDQFVCASIEQDLWYEFKDHRWIKDEKAIELQRKIRFYIVPRYQEAAKKLYDEMNYTNVNSNRNNSDDEDEEEKRDTGEVKEHTNKILKKIDRINSIISSLNSHGFKSSIMKEAQELFFNKDFNDKLDQDPYVLGFNNGVYDLRSCEFRPGRPEDYISTITGYDYKEYKHSDKEIFDILDFFEKIFPDQDLKEYAIDYCAKLLRGYNFEKNFLVFTGEGDNGKSVLIDFLTAALGGYIVKLPTSLIVGKRSQSGAATPELNILKGAIRLAILQEPSSQDQLNDGMIKELTGNDGIYIRGLHKEANKELKPMAKIVLICNRLPRISPLEKAIWNRIRLLYFESKFPKDKSIIPATYEEQKEKKIFPRDESLTEKLKDLKQAFMWYLIQRYKVIKEEKFAAKPEPIKLTEATRLYQENNDIILQYINEYIKKDFSPENRGLNLTEIYNNFKEFYANTFTGGKPPNKIEFRDDLISKWGNLTCGGWRNIRFRTLMDNDDENQTENEK